MKTILHRTDIIDTRGQGGGKFGTITLSKHLVLKELAETFTLLFIVRVKNSVRILAI